MKLRPKYASRGEIFGGERCGESCHCAGSGGQGPAPGMPIYGVCFYYRSLTFYRDRLVQFAGRTFRNPGILLD